MEDSKRKILIQIAENFFPTLESMMISTIQNITGNGQMEKLIAIAKIFYMCNTLKLLPFLIEAGRLDNWIEFLVSILDNAPDASLCQ